jgi:hypothetical protein
MSRFVTKKTYVAGGTIGLASFVAPDPSANDQVAQASVGSRILGICQLDPDQFSTTTSGTPVAALVNEDVSVAPPGALVMLTAGAAGYNAADLLTSDANGNAITAKAGDPIGAYAIDTVVAGEVREVVALPIGLVCPAATSTTGPFATTAANLTLLPSTSRQTITVTATDKTLTLPTVVGNAGYSIRVVYMGASAGGSIGTIITPATADAATVKTYGSMIATPAFGKGVVNTAATSVQGNAIELITDGSNWFVLNVTGTWTRQA